MVIRQIYYTFVQPIFHFFIFAFFTGSILSFAIFSIIKNIGMLNQLGNIFSNILFTEISPLLTVFLLALRSSSAINAEIAVMKVNREIDTMKMFNVNLIEYIFIPRIIALVLGMIVLNFFFFFLSTIGGAFLSKIILGLSFFKFIKIIALTFSVSNVFVILFKLLLFGFFLAIIPLISGLNSNYNNTDIPISVLKGMVKVFIAIILVEVLSLIIKLI